MKSISGFSDNLNNFSDATNGFLDNHSIPSYWVPLLNNRQRILLMLSMVPWAVCMSIFIPWWFNIAHYMTFLGMALASFLCFYEFFLSTYFYFFLLRMKKVNPDLCPSPSWKVAIVITKSPSEPWSIAKKTLCAALNQDIVHDTWLADEDPSIETVEWCRLNDVYISSRKGVSEYHNTSWPRRTRCKEGNLAYFYDRYGYDKYDFVAQLDVDHVPSPSYLKNILVPFLDPSVGYVAAPSICDSNASSSWSARGRLYNEATMHGPLQAGFNNKWAPLCIGSHYAVRTHALRSIGGLGPELAEDHSTTMIMSAYGWRGAFQIDAIANGEGPASFGDCMTQEFQWSRSLTMILLAFTPKYLGKLRPRHKFQFIFAQTWYPAISSVLVLGVTAVLLCLVFNIPLMRISYSDYIGFLFAISVANYLPLLCLKYFKVLRPKDARVISWEEPLFVIARLPWMFIGVASGVYSHIVKHKLIFRVTPKSVSGHSPLAKRVISPYIVIAIICSVVVIAVQQTQNVEGYYVLALASALTFVLIAVLVVVLHKLEAGYPNQKHFLSSLALLFSTILFVGFATWLKFGIGVRSAFSSNPSKLSPFAKVANFGPTSGSITPTNCTNKPCLGVYDFNGAFGKSGIHADISHNFIYWGETYAPTIDRMIAEDMASGRATLITLEPWPWALIKSENQDQFDRLEEDGNNKLLSRIANGYYDRELLASLLAVKKYSSHITYIRLMHEMENTGQYPWSVSDPELFIKAYRYIVNLSKKHNIVNIKWVWSPAGHPTAAKFWPGDQYVDVVGLSIYGSKKWQGTSSNPSTIPTFASLIRDKYWVAQYKKPIILAEVGVIGDKDERSAWFKDSISSLSEFPGLSAWIYFDAPQPKFVPTNIGFPDWSLSPFELTQLKKALLSQTGN